jgi:hypothetical protein
MATEQQEIVTDQEIFDSAVSDTPAPESATEAPEPDATETPERVRDEKGRFAAKEQTEELPPETPTPEPTEETEHRIPSWRLKEEAEAKREYQQRAERAEREAQEFRQQMAQLQAQIQQQAAPKQEPIDPFADPDAFFGRFEEKRLQDRRELEANFSLRLAHMQHGETFEKAFSEAEARAHRGDPSVMRMIAQSQDPGRTLIDWYQREEVMKQVGPDPSAYKSKLADELLEDDEWLAKAAEKFRAKAGAQPTQGNIKLPPSLNKAPGSGQDREGSMADSDLYKYATSR